MHKLENEFEWIIEGEFVGEKELGILGFETGMKKLDISQNLMCRLMVSNVPPGDNESNGHGKECFKCEGWVTRGSMSGCLILFKSDGTISKEAKEVGKYMERDG